MSEAENLRGAVEHMHGCSALFSEVVPVTETFEGQMVWEGEVHVFSLTGHPQASSCFAWSHPVDASEKRQVVTVLAVDPVKTPLDAVRAAIVRQSREERPE